MPNNNRMRGVMITVCGRAVGDYRSKLFPDDACVPTKLGQLVWPAA